MLTGIPQMIAGSDHQGKLEAFPVLCSAYTNRHREHPKKGVFLWSILLKLTVRLRSPNFWGVSK